ncbi:MAG: nucleotidyl transferase AbiEii/AbiGii toxin family protein [Elusimicrobia bacterium]|nr:nucleotidyl transferase AbiEii/AbiGii toxin family protein [Elusimicrobiota bacterium]
MEIYDQLQIREIFHLEFLRFFFRKMRIKFFSIKGGSNLRFFFRSVRYSEDMDIDVSGVSVSVLKDSVLKVLQMPSFQNSIEQFGIERIVLPDMTKAKQTQTTQRFKLHLITSAGEDLFTKIEFSRRGFSGQIVVQTVLDTVLRPYKMPPLMAPHYDIYSTAVQKIGALASRAVIQARDIFDLYVLTSQIDLNQLRKKRIKKSILKKAYENIFEISFERFRDTVVSYLSSEDQAIYNSSHQWDEVRLKVAKLIEELEK